MGYKMKQGRRSNFRKLLLQETLGSDTVDSPDSIQTLKDLMDDRDAWITHCNKIHPNADPFKDIKK